MLLVSGCSVCCGVLRRVVVCHSVLQRVAVCCNVLQRVAACCSVLQRVIACRVSISTSTWIMLLLSGCSVCCSVLQCVAVCCSVLQSVAVCSSVLQCVAVCCSAQTVLNTHFYLNTVMDLLLLAEKKGKQKKEKMKTAKYRRLIKFHFSCFSLLFSNTPYTNRSQKKMDGQCVLWMCVWMHVYMHVCACLYACMCVLEFARVCVNVYMLYVCVSVCMYTCI